VVDASFHIAAKAWALLSAAVPLAFSDGKSAKLNDVLKAPSERPGHRAITFDNPTNAQVRRIS
jgi:hypothetical protein